MKVRESSQVHTNTVMSIPLNSSARMREEEDSIEEDSIYKEINIYICVCVNVDIFPQFLFTYAYIIYIYIHINFQIYTYVHTYLHINIYICMKIHIRKSDVSKEKLNRKKLSHVRSGSIFSRIHSLWVWLLCHAEEAPLSKLMLTD